MSYEKVVEMTTAYKEILDKPDAKLSTYMGQYKEKAVPITFWSVFKYTIPFNVFVIVFFTCIVLEYTYNTRTILTDKSMYSYVLSIEIGSVLLPFILFFIEHNYKQVKYDAVRTPLLDAALKKTTDFITIEVQRSGIDLELISKMHKTVESEMKDKQEWLSKVRKLVPEEI